MDEVADYGRRANSENKEFELNDAPNKSFANYVRHVLCGKKRNAKKRMALSKISSPLRLKLSADSN